MLGATLHLALRKWSEKEERLSALSKQEATSKSIDQSRHSPSHVALAHYTPAMHPGYYWFYSLTFSAFVLLTGMRIPVFRGPPHPRYTPNRPQYYTSPDLDGFISFPSPAISTLDFPLPSPTISKLDSAPMTLIYKPTSRLATRGAA